MTTQTHTVSTDALATLGTIIDETAGRDAIHLAVEPVVAGARLFPGTPIKRGDDGRYVECRRDEAIGIVDPFIERAAFPGERFWLVVMPRTITSLRHVWEHPSFQEDAPTNAFVTGALNMRGAAETWLRNYAEEIDEGFNGLIEAATAYVERGEYYYGARTGDYFGKFEGTSTHPDFWRYYRAYTGKPGADDGESFFTCSC